MVNRPSVPEIVTVNSEALQTQIRDLLPSQNGFGSELQASNVITPIIDLTRAAEGSTTPELLQTAIAFGSQTAFAARGSTVVVENAPGFYRIFGTASVASNSAGVRDVRFDMTDGVSTKIVWSIQTPALSVYPFVSDYDFVVFLAAGESINAVSTDSDGFVNGSSRQIATGDGTLVPPNGFPL